MLTSGLAFTNMSLLQHSCKRTANVGQKTTKTMREGLKIKRGPLHFRFEKTTAGSLIKAMSSRWDYMFS